MRPSNPQGTVFALHTDTEQVSMVGNKASIMVIDNDPYILDFLHELLEQAGFDAHADSDSQRALESVLSNPPDLVLLDVRLPVMDGFAVCRAMKEDAGTAHVPVIFISTLYETEDKVKAFEVGAVDFLTKPFSDVEILARIRTQLKLHRLQSNLEQQVKVRTAELHVEIVECKKVEEALKAKNRELEQFAYSVSHDLNTPMITILGFVERIKKDVAEGRGSNVPDDVQRISAATRKMKHMLDDVLELSRIGRVVNPPEETSMIDLALESVHVFEGRISKGRARVDVADDMPLARVDRSRLLQVYQNLLGNALSFMGGQKKPHIEIGCETGNGEQVFFVRDNGIGIEPQYQTKIFRLFNKLDAKSKGTGVGLALCKKIIEAEGGRIWVESEGRGKGTTFFFTLEQREA